MKAPFRRAVLKKRFKAAGKGRLPQLIVMPSFNSFAGGVAVNRKRKPEELLGPVIKAADMGKAEVSLLDGTLLGKVKGLIPAD